MLGIGRKHAKFQAGIVSYGEEKDGIHFMVESFYQMEPIDVISRGCDAIESQIETIEEALGVPSKKKKAKAAKAEKPEAEEKAEKAEKAEKPEKKEKKAKKKKGTSRGEMSGRGEERGVIFFHFDAVKLLFSRRGGGAVKRASLRG